MNQPSALLDNQLVQCVDETLARYRRGDLTAAQKQAAIDKAFQAYREGLSNAATG